MSTKGKTVLVALGALVVFSLAAGRVRARTANQIEVVAGFGAKEACSCAFVADQSDDYCKAFGQAGVAPAEITIDRKAQTVSASLAGMTRSARFTPGEGCRTEALP
jgi:hypothetical protein